MTEDIRISKADEAKTVDRLCSLTAELLEKHAAVLEKAAQLQVEAQATPQQVIGFIARQFSEEQGRVLDIRAKETEAALEIYRQISERVRGSRAFIRLLTLGLSTRRDEEIAHEAGIRALDEVLSRIEGLHQRHASDALEARLAFIDRLVQIVLPASASRVDSDVGRVLGSITQPEGSRTGS